MKFLISALAVVAVASAEHQPIAIVRQDQDISPDGSYNYAFETENGIAVSESGAPGPLNEDGQPAVVAQGQFQYTAPDGSPIALTYTADENGFHPQGDHLPVGPPIPPLIARALDFLASHPPQRQTNPPVNVGGNTQHHQPAFPSQSPGHGNFPGHGKFPPPRNVPSRPNFPSQGTKRF